MTEADWLAATDPTAMLHHLWGKASDRKLRLFTVAVLTFDTAPDTNPEYRARMEITSLFADGRVSLEVLRGYWGSGENTWPEDAQRWATIVAVDEIAADPLRAHEILTLLRDIFGNPFRLVAADPAWLTSTVVALARQMYDSRDFSPMPILADALQDAGCDRADILDHCRGPGPHVRGCWVVDLLLGKE